MLRNVAIIAHISCSLPVCECLNIGDQRITRRVENNRHRERVEQMSFRRAWIQCLAGCQNSNNNARTPCTRQAEPIYFFSNRAADTKRQRNNTKWTKKRIENTNYRNARRSSMSRPPPSPFHNTSQNHRQWKEYRQFTDSRKTSSCLFHRNLRLSHVV